MKTSPPLGPREGERCMTAAPSGTTVEVNVATTTDDRRSALTNSSIQIQSYHANMRKRLSLYGKLSIVQRAVDIGIRPCARQYGVHPSMVCRWLQQRDALEQVPRRRQKTQKNVTTKQRGAKHPVCEQELSRWVSYQRRMGLTVSHMDLQREMKRLVADPVAFRASNSWVQGFKKRFCLSFRRVTTRSMSVLNYLHEPISEVQEHFVHRVNQNMTGLSHLVNMDEVPVWLDLSSRYTLDTKGIKQVVVRSGSQTRARITVVLTCTGDGRKLPPVILAKSKNQVRNCQDIAGVHVWLQKKAFMDTDTMRAWLSEQYLSSYLRPTTDYTLLLDRAPAHIASSLRTLLEPIHPMFIPGGYTPLLQPLDVGINKTFKDNLRTLYREWQHIQMMNDDIRQSPQTVTPPLHQIAVWVAESWRRVSPQTIQNSFAKVGYRDTQVRQ